MPLVLENNSRTTLPIEVDGVLPETLVGKSDSEIRQRKIWLGRHQVELGAVFRVSGTLDDDLTIVWQGKLESVHWIGAGMSNGCQFVESNAGRHVGSRMSGGSIIARGNVSDFPGTEMSGGEIRIAGDAGDLVGGNYPGSKCGMNRGSILVAGNAGRGVGQSMRRGTIAIGGDVQRLCGWNMRAGTVLVFGGSSVEFGAGMRRGTIVLAGQTDELPLPSFSPGGIYQGHLFSMLGKWLTQNGLDRAESLFCQRFQMYHGDLLSGGRGELFIAL